MGAAYGSDILYSESVEPENRVYNMEKIWEVILILVLAGMGFILQLDRKKENGTDIINRYKIEALKKELIPVVRL